MHTITHKLEQPLNDHYVVCMQTPRKRKTRYSENPPVEGHVGWVIDSTDHVTTASTTTVSQPTAPITVNSQVTGTRYVSSRVCQVSAI